MEVYRLLGRLNARVHLQARGWTPPADFRRQRWDEEGLVGTEPLWGRYADLEGLTPDRRLVRAFDLAAVAFRALAKAYLVQG